MIDNMSQFKNHKLNKVNQAAVDDIRSQIYDLANKLDDMLYDGEEKFTCLRKLKEASMWTTVCISMYGIRK